jgi:hypothetical protein
VLGSSAFVGFLFTYKALITGVVSDDLNATSPDAWHGKRRLGVGFTSVFSRLPNNMMERLTLVINSAGIHWFKLSSLRHINHYLFVASTPMPRGPLMQGDGWSALPIVPSRMAPYWQRFTKRVLPEAVHSPVDEDWFGIGMRRIVNQMTVTMVERRAGSGGLGDGILRGRRFCCPVDERGRGRAGGWLSKAQRGLQLGRRRRAKRQA